MHSGPLFELSGGRCISAIIYIAVRCTQATFATWHDFYSSFLTFLKGLREMHVFKGRRYTVLHFKLRNRCTNALTCVFEVNMTFKPQL
jgi:hypothetical protein